MSAVSSYSEQLKLFQGSAKGYRLEEDPYFSTWFNSLVVIEDKEAYELSLGIQPERNPAPKGHRKTDSFTSHSSSENIEGVLQRKVDSSVHAKFSKQ